MKISEVKYGMVIVITEEGKIAESFYNPLVGVYAALSYLTTDFALPGKENEAIHFHLTLDWHVWQGLSLIQTHLSVS